jgi:hypothetical protein
MSLSYSLTVSPSTAMSKLSFSFPVSAEASFILTRYLQELEQRVLLRAATIAADEMEEEITPAHLYQGLRKFTSGNEIPFMETTFNNKVNREWKNQKTQPTE